MLLRTVKQIRSDDVARINRNKAKINFLFNLRDAAFLREDILTKNLQKIENGYYFKTLIHKNIGPLVTPEYGLVRSQIGNIFYFKGLSLLKTEEPNFTVGLTSSEAAATKAGVAVFVDMPTQAWKEFSFDPFHCGDTEGRGNILTVAAYFYNKKAMYKKTHNSLLEKRLELEAALGEAYTSDLIALFSSNKREKNIKNFNIPKKNLSKEVLPYERNDPKDLFIQKCKTIDFAEIPSYVDAFYGYIEACLFLGPANTLVLDARYRETVHSGGGSKAVAKEDAKFTKFADEQLNAWLKNLEQLTAFGLDIYEGLKPKILIGAI